MTCNEVLGPGGAVEKKLPGYEVRPQQLDMAEAVAAAFDDEEHLLVEAGTGVGKSFAYLIPAIQQVLANDSRVVVSTHTIALQEQLIDKDIPFLRSVFEDEFKAVLVKGRSNYVGLRRLARTSGRQKMLFDAKGHFTELHAIEDWAYETADGSLSDLDQQPNPTVWDRVRSDGDDCMGRRCPQFQKCFYQRARRRASEAQILIVNHALLFSDIAVRRLGASILPDYDYVVLDEAHTVENAAGNHLGIGISDTQVRYLLNTLHSERTGRGVLGGKNGRDVVPVVREVREALGEYFNALTDWHAEKGDWNGRLREPPPLDQPLSTHLMLLHDAIRKARENLTNDEDRSEFAGLMDRCKVMAGTVEEWHDQKREGWVYWLEVTSGQRHRVTLGARPIDVGPELEASLFSKVKSTVLTSATLTTSSENPFAFIRGRIGLSDARDLALGSPFDYRRQLQVYVERHLPEPGNGEAFLAPACVAIEKYVKQTSGRAFVLFTSYRMLRECAERLAYVFEEEQMPLLVQGSGVPRSRMLETFRKVPRSVLFGTDSFWTGVDVPGESLSNVIIVKLPFAVPNEPVIEARIEKIREDGGNPFMEFQVPEAVLKFRQGTGRLIRTAEDRGIIVILDSRVRSKPYGRRFLDALPDCEIIDV